MRPIFQGCSHGSPSALGRAGPKPHLVLAAPATGVAVDDLSLRLGEARCSAFEAFSHLDHGRGGGRIFF